jgi:hypothetical protein
METQPAELRETAVSDKGKSKVAEAKPRFDPTRIFVQRDRLVWFWFGFAMLVLVGAAVAKEQFDLTFSSGFFKALAN